MDRIHELAMRLTNTSKVEKKIDIMEVDLDDLLNQVEKSVQNSEQTFAKLNGLRDIMKNVKVIIFKSVADSNPLLATEFTRDSSKYHNHLCIGCIYV